LKEKIAVATESRSVQRGRSRFLASPGMTKLETKRVGK
jgi:hypothetical protein